MVKILSIFVAFLENMNFKCHKWEKMSPWSGFQVARNVVFLIKTVLNGGIRAISLRKKRVKPGIMLIETVLS